MSPGIFCFECFPCVGMLQKRTSQDSNFYLHLCTGIMQEDTCTQSLLTFCKSWICWQADPSPQPVANGTLSSTAKSQDGAEASAAASSPPQQSPPQPVPIEVTLQKDAYLVFRALCKLSIRSSDNSASADLTVMRGKVSLSLLDSIAVMRLNSDSSCLYPRWQTN